MQLPPSRLNLVGLSLGGLLALNYAVQHPAQINSLVLIGTPYEIPKRLLKLQKLCISVHAEICISRYGNK